MSLWAAKSASFSTNRELRNAKRSNLSLLEERFATECQVRRFLSPESATCRARRRFRRSRLATAGCIRVRLCYGPNMSPGKLPLTLRTRHDRSD
jgi:hypothetical protein